MISDWDRFSFHSIERTKERQNIKSIKKACRSLKLAVKRGKSAEAFKGWEQRYLRQQSREGCKALAYNGFCYIVSENTNVCITVYPLPEWFNKKHDHPLEQMLEEEYEDEQGRYRKPNRRSSQETI